jgi:hypothetical protein
VSRLAPASALLAALGLALAAAPAGAQDLPVDPESVGIPQNSAISEQYQAAEQAVQDAVPTPATPPAVEPVPVVQAPPPAPEPEQYHSETPTNVSVTQTQPSNVNVSIRINSPGDDGPVVQINNAGGKAVVEQVVQAVQQRPAPAANPPRPDDGPPSGLPEDWEWEWDSACFGGAAAAAAAAAMPRWKWRWSCKAADELDLPNPVDVVPAMPDVWVPDSVESVLPPSVLPSTPAGLAPAAPAARPDRRARAERQPPRRPGATAPVSAGGSDGPPAAGAMVAATAAVPAAVAEQVDHAVRNAVEARPAPADVASLIPPGGGSALGAGSGIGAVASLMLGLWIAVLTTAIVLVVPRLRRRRRSGPAWRLTRQCSPRLERPG